MPLLTYEQDEQLLGIYKLMAEANAEDEGKDPDLQQILNRFYQAKVVPQLFSIVLRPYQPTILHRIWNNYWRAKGKIDQANLQSGMTRVEWGGIVTDFFMVSGIGILPSNDFAQALGLTSSSSESKNSKKNSTKETANPILPILFFMGSLSSTLRRKASVTGKPSEEPTP